MQFDSGTIFAPPFTWTDITLHNMCALEADYDRKGGKSTKPHTFSAHSNYALAEYKDHPTIDSK